MNPSESDHLLRPENYRRVMPRDLFNEANLLKCYGQIYLNLEKCPWCDAVLLHPGEEPFLVAQDESGSLFLANVRFVVRGSTCTLKRPLNSRAPWPLYVEEWNGAYCLDEILVFDEQGNFSEEMLKFLTGG